MSWSFCLCTISCCRCKSLLCCTGPHTMVRLDLTTVPANSGSDPNKRKGARQTGMMNFYKGTIRCLGCKRHIPSGKLPSNAGVEGPGLCEVCSSQEGKWEEVYLECLQHVDRLEHRQAGAQAYCMRCHSGGMTGKVVCENGECPVLYARVESAARLVTVNTFLRRLDW